MLSSDKIIAYTALFSTIGIGVSDVNEAAKALGYRESLPYDGQVLFKSKGKMSQQHFQNRVVSTTKPFLRNLTSAGFFYLAWKDYQRATSIRNEDGTSSEYHLANVNWKSWTVCGLAGIAAGPLASHSGTATRSTERQLQSRNQLPKKMVRGLFTRWASLVDGRGVVLIVSLPAGLWALVHGRD